MIPLHSCQDLSNGIKSWSHHDTSGLPYDHAQLCQVREDSEHRAELLVPSCQGLSPQLPLLPSAVMGTEHG